MSTEHTPGPWEAHENGVIYTPGPNDTAVLIADAVTDSDQERPTPVQAANARLIAAAPDLLTVTKLLVVALSEAESLSLAQLTDVLDRAGAAVEKATGERT